MAFKLNLSAVIKNYPVELRVINENGKQEIHKIGVDFKRFNREELEKINPTEEIKRMLKAKQDASSEEDKNDVPGLPEVPRLTEAESLESDVDWAMKYVVGWHEVDIDGSTEFNRENLRKLFSQVGNATLDFFKAFMEAHNGGKRKN